jgi:multiple sugar transport system permease protein
MPRLTKRSPIGGWGMALAFLTPALGLMALFKLWPIWAAVSASFSAYDPGGNHVGYVGTDNYAAVLADERFRYGLWLTIGIVLVKVPLQIALGLGTALLLQTQTTLNKMGRALIVSPVFLGLPITSLLSAYIFDSDLGLANAAIAAMGLDPVAWLNAPNPGRVVVILLSVWRDLGLTMLVLLAGLAAVPKELVLAAKVDGAGASAIFRTITWPLLRRSVQFVVVLATLATVQLVVPVLILTRGGPLGATDVAAYQIYEHGFEFFDFGRASAMSLVLMAGLFVVIAMEMRWLRTDWRPA